MVVDDAAFIRELLIQIAKKTSVEIVGEASDGEEAVTMALDKKPDLIVMDLVMPRKSGIQATKEILEKLPKTKIVACSTEGQETMVLKAMEAGCVNCITKPFQIQDVLKVFQEK